MQLNASRLVEVLISPKAVSVAGCAVAALCAAAVAFEETAPEAPEVAVVAGASAFKPVVLSPAKDSIARPLQDRLPNDEASLTRAIQRELQRIGCYDGAVNGQWTRSSRKSMSRLIENVNARLPADKPDAVLLALAKSQAEGACDDGATVAPAVMERAATASRTPPSQAGTDTAPRQPVDLLQPTPEQPPQPIEPMTSASLEQTAYEPPAPPATAAVEQPSSTRAAAMTAATATVAAPLALAQRPAEKKPYARTHDRSKWATARKRHKGTSLARSFRSLKRTLRFLF